jgi:uncharacterized membrane protein YgcG
MDATPGARGSGALLGGRYEIGALVGLGGTARVYRARDDVGDTTVAVKIFPAGSGAGPGGDGSQELAVLSGMRHPALVGVRDSGVDDEGRPFVVMDFVEGQSLAARLRDGVLSVPAAVRLGAVLADALAHVHARGIVHRDVKPGNVLLDGEGRPQLTDFGIARLVDATRVTATGLVVGTAAYMAPEQVRGEVVGPPADVYALGLLLLEAVTGRREFEGGALESAIARLHRDPVVPPEISEPLGSVIRRMTATDPAQRPAASAAAAALRAGPPAARRRPLEGPLARRLISAGAFASLAASVVAGMVLLTGADNSPSAPGTPPVQVAAPVAEPVGAALPEPSITTAPVVDAPVAVAPTSQQRRPVPVALARRARPTTVTRTVVRVTTAPKDADRSTKSRAPKKDKDKDKKDDKGKPDKPKDDPKDEPKDDTGADQGGDTIDNSGGTGSDNSGNSGSGSGNSGSDNSGSDNSGSGSGYSGSGSGNSGPGGGQGEDG